MINLNEIEGEGKLGIANIKICLMFAFSVHNAYDKAMEDGTISIKDLPCAYEPTTQLIPAITAAPLMIEEAMDLDHAEKEELKSWVENVYDISKDELEVKIEAGLNLVIEMAHFVGVVF